ncbi:hypothetical protein Tco_1301959 [Tanacetum coccineum]
MMKHCTQLGKGTNSWNNISNNSNSDGIATIVNKLDNLGRDMKKLKENVHAIQVGCQLCGGPHLDKECPLNEETKSMEKVKYEEFGRPFPNNNRINERFGGGVWIHAEQDEWLKKLYLNTETSQDNHDKVIQSLENKNQLPPKEQDPGSFILPCSIGRIDKFTFPVDFVILDIIEDYRMPIILGRPLLCTSYAKVYIFWKPISLEVRNEKVIFKMRISLTTTMFESVRAIKSKIYMGDDNLIDSESCRFDQLLDIEPDIFTYDINMQGSYKELNTDQEMSKEYESVKEINLEQHLGPTEKRVHWCETISQEKDGVHEYWALCNPYNDICDGGGLPNDVEKLYWESTNDNERVDLEWEELSFNNWVRLKFGRVCKMTKDRILKD